MSVTPHASPSSPESIPRGLPVYSLAIHSNFCVVVSSLFAVSQGRPAVFSSFGVSASFPLSGRAAIAFVVGRLCFATQTLLRNSRACCFAVISLLALRHVKPTVLRRRSVRDHTAHPKPPTCFGSLGCLHSFASIAEEIDPFEMSSARSLPDQALRRFFRNYGNLGVVRTSPFCASGVTPLSKLVFGILFVFVIIWKEKAWQNVMFSKKKRFRKNIERSNYIIVLVSFVMFNLFSGKENTKKPPVLKASQRRPQQKPQLCVLIL